MFFNHGYYKLTGNQIGLDVGDKPLECRGEWISLADAMTMLEAQVGEEDRVQTLIDEVTALIRLYLGRDLLDCTHTDKFFRPNTYTIQLSNWPVTLLTSIRQDGSRLNSANYEVDTQLGVVYNKCNTASTFKPCNGFITINYDAGYIPPPLVLQSMFRALLADYYASGGSTEGSVGSIKKVSLTGVAAVEFNNPSGITYSGIDRQLGVPNALKQYVGILDPYRSNLVQVVA